MKIIIENDDMICAREYDNLDTETITAFTKLLETIADSPCTNATAEWSYELSK